jgi:prepilin-type N-terminal cleavage/methylation domain-containing protein
MMKLNRLHQNQPSTSRMKHRRGFTLIELIVVLSLWGAILPLAGGTICLLLRAQTATADSLADGMTLSRFAQTFRADVHAARKARGESLPAKLVEEVVLELDSARTISYTTGATAGDIVRTARKGDVTERREEFRLVGTQTRFEVGPEGRTVAALHAPRGFALSGAPIVPRAPSMRIEAVVGRDPRIVRIAKSMPKEPPAPALPRKPKRQGHNS